MLTFCHAVCNGQWHTLLHGMVTRYHALALHLHHTLGTWHSQFLCFQILWPTAVLPPVWNHTLTLFCFHQKLGILRQQVLDFKTPPLEDKDECEQALLSVKQWCGTKYFLFQVIHVSGPELPSSHTLSFNTTVFQLLLFTSTTFYCKQYGHQIIFPCRRECTKTKS